MLRQSHRRRGGRGSEALQGSGPAGPAVLGDRLGTGQDLNSGVPNTGVPTALPRSIPEACGVAGRLRVSRAFPRLGPSFCTPPPAPARSPTRGRAVGGSLGGQCRTRAVLTGGLVIE